MSRIKKLSLLGLAVLALSWAPTMATADDGRVTIQPAVLQSSGNSITGATVQPVRWRGGVWFGGPAYYGGWYRPYYGGFYPGYYGYGYPAYGYGYSPYGVYYTWW